MIRKRKKPVSVISSSEDDCPQPRKYLKSSKTHNQQSAESKVFFKNSHKTIERQQNNSWSSDSSSIQRPRMQVKNKLIIITSEESSSSEDEELVHPARRGALRALSDYEMGYGSKKTTNISPAHLYDIEYREGSNYVNIVNPNMQVGMPTASSSFGLPSHRLPTSSTVVPKGMRIVSSNEQNVHNPIRQEKSYSSSINNKISISRDNVENRVTGYYSHSPSPSGNSSPILDIVSKGTSPCLSESSIHIVDIVDNRPSLSANRYSSPILDIEDKRISPSPSETSSLILDTVDNGTSPSFSENSIHIVDIVDNRPSHSANRYSSPILDIVDKRTRAYYLHSPSQSGNSSPIQDIVYKRATACFSDSPSTSGNSSLIQQRANRGLGASSSMGILTAVSDGKTPTITIQNSNDGEEIPISISDINDSLSTSDSDDTLPLKKPGRRGAMRIVYSDEESDHRPIRPKKSHTSNMINRNNVRNVRRDLDNRGTAHYSDRPSTSGNSSPIQQRAFRSQRASSSMSILTAVSDEQTPTVTIQNSLSNDGENTSTLNNSDSDDTSPLKKPGRRGAHVPLPESDEDVPHDPSTCKEKSLNSSSDESECCPICFLHFNSQEIGKPANCDHSFCLSCIQEWAKNNNTCPVDRKLFNSIIVRSYNSYGVIRVIPVEDANPVILWDEEEWNVVLLNNDSYGDLSWTEEDSYNSFDYDGPDEACCICQWPTNIYNIVTCDNCLEVYHLSCLDPPLSHIPAEDWYCPDCEKDDTSTEKSSSESSFESSFELFESSV